MFELAWFGTRRIVFFGCTSTVVHPIVERLRRDPRVSEVHMTQPVPDHPIVSVSIRLACDAALVEVEGVEGEEGEERLACRTVVSEAVTACLASVEEMRAVAYAAISDADRAAVDRRRQVERDMEAAWATSHPEQLPYMTLDETARRVYNQEDRVPNLWFPRREWASIGRNAVANLIVGRGGKSEA